MNRLNGVLFFSRIHLHHYNSNVCVNDAGVNGSVVSKKGDCKTMIHGLYQPCRPDDKKLYAGTSDAGKNRARI